MGRGDKRTRKGKITIGSYGKSRPRKVAVSAEGKVVSAPSVAKAAPKVAKAATAPKPAADKKKKA